MKYPVGIQTFEDIRTKGYVYVDKTALVYKMVDEGKIYFLSRPRRFGKSLLVSTLHSYFDGRKDLFEGLAISKQETEWKKYPVFHFDFNSMDFTEEWVLKKTLNSQLTEYEEIFGHKEYNETIGDRFNGLLKAAYEQTGRQCVVLIDEYDKPILDVLDTDIEDKNRNTLKGFYSTFKRADAYLKFVLLTGVTKFSQVSVFSGFNQPLDISMNPAYDALCGITEEELFSVFAESIEEMADNLGCSAEKVKKKLKQTYDGYHFSKKMLDIYNPFSILNAFVEKDFGDYWFATGTPTYLVKLLNHSGEDVKDLTNKYYDASMFADYKADVEQPLPMIYQSGYFTIKGYNARRNRYRLDFPNNEVSKGFLSILAAGYFKKKNQTPYSDCQDMYFMLEDGEVESFITHLTAFLASIPYDSHEPLKDIDMTERHFQYTFYLIMRLMGTCCQVYNEKESSYGRCDCIIETDDYVYIIEFKLDGTADEAIAHIEEKGYALPYAADNRKVVKLGIVFSSETRTVGEWTER